MSGACILCYKFTNNTCIMNLFLNSVFHEYLHFLHNNMSMSMPSPAPSPTPAPTMCDLTDGKSYTFDSYIKESDLIFDDTYVHHMFSMTVKCDCSGKAVNGGSVGPTSEVNLVDQSVVAGPIVQVVNNKDLQVDWEGSALEEDAPGWTIVVTGGGLCFTPAAEVGICLVVAGLATEVFDDEILWGYCQSISFKCIKDGDSWKVQMMEMGLPLQETFKTNESEFYTEFMSTSSAIASGIVPFREQLHSADVTSKGAVSSASSVSSLVALSALVISSALAGVV